MTAERQADERFYKLSRRANFRVLGDEVRGQLFGAVFTLPLDFYRLLLEFAAPATIREVHQRVETGMDLAALKRLLELPINRGILLPEGPQGRLSILEVLNPSFVSKLREGPELKQHFEAGQACFLRDALEVSFAQRVLRELEELRSFSVHENSYGKDHLLPQEGMWPASIAELRDILDHPDSKRAISEATGQNCYGPMQMNPALYLPGDSSGPHSDWADERTVAFVWYLAHDWDSDWGGSFYWAKSANFVVPQFNTLALFVVSHDSNHLVTTLTPFARGRRWTVAGWWTAATQAVFNDWMRPSKLIGWHSGPRLTEVAPDVFFTSR
jgi:hypothetical protein